MVNYLMLKLRNCFMGVYLSMSPSHTREVEVPCLMFLNSSELRVRFAILVGATVTYDSQRRGARGKIAVRATGCEGWI